VVHLWTVQGQSVKSATPLRKNYITTQDITGNQPLTIDLFETFKKNPYNPLIPNHQHATMTSFKIICPYCRHDHDVPAQYFKGESRLLKCAQCEHVWRHYVSAPATLPTNFSKDDMAPIIKPAVSPSKSQERAQSHSSSKRASASAAARQASQQIPPPASFRAQKRNPYKPSSKKYHLDWWLLVVACLIAAFVVVREMGGIPIPIWAQEQGQRFYNKIMLSLEPLPFFKKKEALQTPPSKDPISFVVLTSNLTFNGTEPILNIKAEIANNTSQDINNLNPIRVELMDKCENGQDGLCLRHSWTHTLTHTPLKAGEHHIFETIGECHIPIQPDAIILSLEKR